MSFPLPNINGMLSPWTDIDLVALPSGTIANVVRMFVTITDAPSGGPAVVTLANAVSAGGDTLVATVPDGERSIEVTGSLPLDGAKTLYLSVTDASNGIPMNLSGWFETDGAATIISLTTLARVKRELNMSSSDQDTLLGELISGVSSLFQQETFVSFVQAAYTGQRASGSGFTDELLMAHVPVLASPAPVLRDSNGDTVATSSYRVVADAGILQRTDGLYWSRGSRNYEADYTAGYSSIPADVVDAVTSQVVYQYRQTSPGGANRGLASRSGGAGETESFVAGPLEPLFRRAIARYRRYS